MNILNSINDFNEAKAVIAGGVNSPVRAFNSVGGNPRMIKSAHDCYLIDEDDNEYIDFVQSWGPLIFGHKDAAALNAIKGALENGVGYGAPTVLETKLAKEIIASYEGIERVRLVNSGTEATMSAIRVGRAFSGRDDIIKFDGCYHGHSDSLLVSAGSGCATFGSPSSPGVPSDISRHTLVARYNDIESVKSCIATSAQNGGGVGVIIIEPIAGNMGLVPANVDFLQELRALCDAHKIVLIFDEVMSGFRASFSGSQGFHEIVPDLATFGKVIGGGMPLAAFGGRADIMSLLSPMGAVYQAGTLSGNPVAVSAGLATLMQIKQNRHIYDYLQNLAEMLTDGMQRAAQNAGIALQTSVRGSMFGFFFNDKPVQNFDDAKQSDTALFARFHQKMLERGVYFAPSTFETGFICTAMDESIIKKVLGACESAFFELANE